MESNMSLVITKEPITESATVQVAYVPYRTFKSAIEMLEQHGLPNRIDRTLWPSFSGVIQSQLISAFRFLGLIKQDGTPTPELEAMVHDKAGRKALLRARLKEAYPNLIKIDLPKATIGLFNDAMRKYELSPETTKKASSFFLQAAKDSELPLSKHILDKTRAVRKRKPIPNRPNDHSGSQIVPVATGPVRTISLENSVTLSVATSADTFSMTKGDREFVSQLLDLLDRYEEEHAEEEIEQEEENA
jgi:hypothetical protein